MKKFKFKLDAVLKLRQRIEDELKKQLADLKKELEFEVALLVKYRNDKITCQNELKGLRSSHLDIKKIIMHENYLEVLNENIEVQVVRVAEAKEAVEVKRLELLEASKDKKAVEKLHEKKFAEHVASLQSTEQKFLDEISTMRFTRQTGEV